MIGLLFPLISGLVQQYQQKQAGEAIKGLLGTPEGARAGDEGPVQVPGRGLLANPTDPTEQMKFAAGLMGVPGGRSALQAFQPMLNQAIQSKQWSAQFDQQNQHYDRTEARLTDQFQQQFGLQREEAQAMAQQRIQQQANWQAQFNEQIAQHRQQAGMEGARLALSREQFAWDKGKEARAAGADMGVKPPSGYGVVDTASGRSFMPMPGTQDFAKVKEGYGATNDAIKTIDSLMDEYLGPEGKTAGGKTRRAGGAGSESFGPAYASMNAKRGSILTALGQAREMGVLDHAEYERLTKQLPEVGEWFTSNKTWENAYKGVRAEFARKKARQEAANPWLLPPPPAGFRPK